MLRFEGVVPLFHRLPFQSPPCHGLKWKDALEERGAGGQSRGGVLPKADVTL